MTGGPIVKMIKSISSWLRERCWRCWQARHDCLRGAGERAIGPFKPFDPPSTYTAISACASGTARAKTAKSLFDPTGTAMVSRLTYDDFSIFTAEGLHPLRFQQRLVPQGLCRRRRFPEGQAQGRGFSAGHRSLFGDLEPQDNGSPIYASVDVGYNIFRGPDFHVGAFVGYHYLNETVSAYGCGQIATNPLYLRRLPGSGPVKVITQVNNWHSLRVGLDAAVEIGNRVKLSVDAAWLPYVTSPAPMRTGCASAIAPGAFNGPVPEDGNGWGYQLDAFSPIA